MSDQLVAEVAIWIKYKKNTRRKPMPSAGFELAIPEIERLKTDALDHANTGTGKTVHIKTTF
jgi:hypothetical protein